jgi:hypothetical protein
MMEGLIGSGVAADEPNPVIGRLERSGTDRPPAADAVMDVWGARTGRVS